MTITIKLGATASRRLDWQSILYQGDIQTVRITDPRGTGALTDADPTDCFLTVGTFDGGLVGVAGPFAAVTGEPEEEGGEAPVVAWEATLSLANDDAAVALSDLLIGERTRLWSRLLDTSRAYSMGVGDVILEGAPDAGGGSTPVAPGSYLTTAAFEGLDVTAPTTLSALRAQVQAILNALKGE